MDTLLNTLKSIWEKIKGLWGAIGSFFSLWTKLFRIVWRRLIIGFQSPDFIIYFIVVIVIVGGMGFWPIAYKIFIDGDSTITIAELAKSMSTYFIAIIASSSADLILTNKPDQVQAKVLRMPAIAMLVIGAILLVLIQIELNNDTMTLAYVGLTLALVFWWIANSIDPIFADDSTPPSSTLGSSPNSGLPGTLTGLNA